MKIRLNTGSAGLYQPRMDKFNTSNNKAHSQNINFKGTLPSTKSPFIDWLMTRKATKGLFKLASLNPFAFNVAAMAITCILMRPPTIMVVPGSNKEDKSYAAAKSIIGSIIANGSRLIFILPLGILMKKLGQKALKDNHLQFPKIETKEYEAYNYLISNGAGFLLSLGLSAPIIYTLTKVMNKIMPPKEVGKRTKTFNNKDLNKNTTSTNTNVNVIAKGGKNGH